MRHSLRSLLVAFLVLSAHSYPALADVYAVCAGITDYPGTQNDLHLPARDAATMASLYRKDKTAHVVLLTDSQATTAGITGQMAALYAQAGDDDLVVFFFSGHGTQGAFCAYDGLLTYGQVRTAMACSACRNKMIFADACFSGKIRDNNRHVAHKDLNVMLFLSSRSDETSIERSNMKNGLFTACLNRALRGGADADRNRIITAKELFTAVSRGVIQMSGGRQHPVMWGNFADDMPVAVLTPRTKK